MLYRNAPFLVASAGLCLLYVIYNSHHDGDRDGSGVRSRGGGRPSRSFLRHAPSPSSAEEDDAMDGGEAPPLFSDAAAAASARAEAEEAALRSPRPPPDVLFAGPNRTRLKTVLYWNEFYGRYDTYDFGYGHQAFMEKEGCSVSDCFATKDRSLLPIDQFDAIIIHIRGLPNDLPRKRSPHQRYIMLSIEAPLHLYEFRSLNDLSFNWTMTYRLDSDFPIPYAWIDRVEPLPGPVGSSKLQSFIRGFGRRAAKEGPNLADGKVGLAVQFVSNCHSSSQREAYVRELKKYIPVDVYGKCGEFNCPAADGGDLEGNGEVSNVVGGWDCYEVAKRKYKFILSFEDAICRDYATEAFFAAYNSEASFDVVPVVLGGANYTALGAPPHSYVDASSHAGPKQLAHFLKLLDADDARYNEYFWWRKFYRRRFQHHQALCDVCERLNREDGAAGQSYKDMEDWWIRQAKCKSSPEAPLWAS